MYSCLSDHHFSFASRFISVYLCASVVPVEIIPVHVREYNRPISMLCVECTPRKAWLSLPDLEKLALSIEAGPRR